METKEITNLNIVYIEAEKLLEQGYKMYYTNQLVEAFVLFLRFTKFFYLIYNHKHLIINNKRHKQLNESFKKVIPILEKIKPYLIKKYEKYENTVISKETKEEKNINLDIINELELKCKKLLQN